MTIIDRYLLRHFTQLLLICFCSLVGLFAVIDALGHIDRFTQQAEQVGSNVLVLVAKYYALQSVVFFDRTSGILTLMAGMFTLTWLKRHNELTALMAAGITVRRVVMPILIAACTVAILAATIRESILPAFRSQLIRNTSHRSGSEQQPLRPTWDPASKILIGGAAVIAAQQKIIRPFLLLPPDSGRAVGRVSAAQAAFLPANDMHPAGYLLFDVHTRLPLLQQPSLKVGDRVVLLSRQDASWLKKDQLFLVSDVDFDQLAAGPQWHRYASTAELIQYVGRPSGDVPTDAHVALHNRFVRPLIDTALVIIGLPLILTRRDRSPFLAVGLAMALVAGFLAVSMASEFIGTSGWISPALAAWLPLFFMVPLAVANSAPLQ